MDRFNAVYKKLLSLGQEHLLSFYNDLSDSQKAELLNQIEKCDFSVIELFEETEKSETTSIIEPIDVMTVEGIKKNNEHYSSIGINAISNGKVAAVLLAGGQGTRLGVDKSKGMVNIGKTRELFIFECLINNLIDVVEKSKAWIPLCIMTSEINNDDIVKFLTEKNFFGYNKEFIYFFVQETLPVLDFNKKLVLCDKSKLSVAPNGNGGWFSSLIKSGIYNTLKKNGIEWLNCFSIDNVLQRIADPTFIGATIEGEFDCGAKVIKKIDIHEKVGHICLKNSKPSIIEYYEISEELLNQKGKNGNRAYDYGVTLNYLFKTDKLEQTLENNLPVHIVKKKTSYIDNKGVLTQPAAENCYKFETLILDIVEMIGNCLPFEVIRNKEFAPIKNKHGADSIDSAQQLLIENGIVI